MKAEAIRELLQGYDMRASHREDADCFDDDVFMQTRFLGEIAAQLAELNASVLALVPDANMPEECRQKKCTYYNHYLAYGPAELTHEGFHAAERNGEQHFQGCPRSQEGEPCTVCDGYERRLRA